VLYADVLELPNGMSKGCGIVEYETAEMAQKAIHDMSNKNLMGRLIYVREVSFSPFSYCIYNLLTISCRIARLSPASVVEAAAVELAAWVVARRAVDLVEASEADTVEARVVDSRVATAAVEEDTVVACNLGAPRSSFRA